jgi:hypothetical protein
MHMSDCVKVFGRPPHASKPLSAKVPAPTVAWRSQLVGIILPANIQNLLADELVKAVRECR